MEPINICSKDNENFIKFLFQESQTNPDYPRDFGFAIEVRSLSVQGMVPSIWFHEHDFDCFVSRLSSLEEKRQGHVRLDSFCPDEFWIEFLTTGRPGRVHARGRLTQQSSLVKPEFWSSVGFDFEVDQSMLHEIVKKFRSVWAGVVLDSDL